MPRAGSTRVTWVRSIIQAMAVSVGGSYTQMSGDFTAGSFATLRAEKNQQSEWNAPVFQWLVRRVIRPIRSRYMDLQVGLGNLPIPGGNRTAYIRGRKRRRLQRFLAVPSRREFLNPKEDVDAAIAAISRGLMSVREWAASRGMTRNQLLTRVAEDITYMEDNPSLNRVLTTLFSVQGASDSATTKGDGNDNANPEPKDQGTDAPQTGFLVG